LQRIGETKPNGDLAQLPGLLDLANLPTLAVKLTAAPAYALGDCPFTSIQPAIRRLYEHFGPERLFWGTDITRLRTPWRDCVTMFTEHLEWLPESDPRLIMGEAVCRWHGWDRAARAELKRFGAWMACWRRLSTQVEYKYQRIRIETGKPIHVGECAQLLLRGVGGEIRRRDRHGAAGGGRPSLLDQRPTGGEVDCQRRCGPAGNRRV
jgi:hypothetical protein